jgi:hypothetical protein
MKAIYLGTMLAAVLLSFQQKKTNNYWDDASVNGTRIYSICFIDNNCGYAVSADNHFFISTDAGNNWKSTRNIARFLRPGSSRILWSAEIFCSVMQTKDGGTTWVPYTKEKQKHFCRVYLKDPNAGYETADEFLNNISKKIFNCFKNGDLRPLTDHPQQCTEYYSSKDEGWALGWCVKEFRTHRDLAGLK